MLNDGMGGGTKSAGCDQTFLFSSTANPFVLGLSCSPASCRASCRDALIEFRFFWPRGSRADSWWLVDKPPAPGTTTSWCWSLQGPDGRGSWKSRSCASLSLQSWAREGNSEVSFTVVKTWRTTANRYVQQIGPLEGETQHSWKSDAFYLFIF